ncbi:MAG: hypothetical protein CMP48_15850 [Rickettsiales bacterium]|nr:hypothetical protein [Rickettsiales bacterium]
MPTADYFYFGMKVKLGDEIGLVIKPEIQNEWDHEPGLIRWDTRNENKLKIGVECMVHSFK